MCGRIISSGLGFEVKVAWDIYCVGVIGLNGDVGVVGIDPKTEIGETWVGVDIGVSLP